MKLHKCTYKLFCIFRQIAEAEASEKEIIRSMEKEFGNLAEALPVEDPNDKLSRLNLLFDKESVGFNLMYM